MLRGLLSVCVFGPLWAVGQTSSLSDATLTISPGTSLRINSPMSWQLDPGAAIINDGLIDLGTEGVIQEQDGAPITGSGIERAVWPLASPMADAEPGNLGLTLTTSYSNGGLTVERGHLPRFADNGTPGIGRWYRVATPVPTAFTFEATLQYDLTELGASQPSALALFVANDANGQWSPVLTTINPQQNLSGSTPAPEVFITAFDLDLATNAPSGSAGVEWSVSPTLVEEQVCIESRNGQSIGSLELMDSQGRMVVAVHELAMERATVDMTRLPGGSYILRINKGAHAFKLVKR
ncbi:MAG TPA: T9SS type A sorting domain-containing protein [Flavobacteriales bacterium]|nr:T9SS type A sorting domain-containing protein [Flavobacteriales bacterium]